MSDMPVFVKIHDPRDIHDTIAFLKLKIDETRETLGIINKISEQEDMKVREWDTRFKSVTEKIDDMTHLLHNPEKI